MTSLHLVMSRGWTTIAVAYVGTQGFVDIAERIIRARGGE